MKILYRCLYIGRPALANPVIDLLTSLTRFHRGLLTDDLFSAFDLSIVAIPKLLALKEDVKVKEEQRKEIRNNFIRFYLSFISNSSVIVRRDLIAQKKVISSWFKYLTYDNADTIKLMIDTLTKRVLKEPSYLRATKINLFNDWSISFIAKLLGRTDTPTGETENLGTIVYNFLIFLTSDMTYGIRFPSNEWLFSETNEANSDIRLNNRILLSVIKTLKPWEHVQRQDLVLSILSHCPELVMPYLKEDYALSLDPKLSVFWISNVLFFSRFVQTPLPSEIVDNTSFQAPKVENIIEHIIPSPLSKLALTKTLLHTNALVKFNGYQIIVFAFNKLEAVIALYKEKGWIDAYYQLIEEVLNRIPDLQTFTNSANSIENMESNRLLKTIMIKAIASYAKVLPEIFVKSKFSLPKSLGTSLEKTQLDGLELVDLRNVLEVQAKLGGISKWWNKLPQLSYSLFTSLLRLCALLNDKLFTDQITNLIEYLSKPTMLFRSTSLISPVSVLIHALQTSIPYMSTEEQNKVWKLFDESVSRCLRSPYKYLDKLSSFQIKTASKHVSVSPFLAIIIEQWKYVDKTTDYSKVELWFKKYLRDSIISGENFAIISELAKEAQLNVYSSLRSIEKSKFQDVRQEWEYETETEVLNHYFCERVISYPSSKLVEVSSQRIASSVDLFFTLFRLRFDEDPKVRKALVRNLQNIPSILRPLLVQKEVWDEVLTHDNFDVCCEFLRVLQNSFEEKELRNLTGFDALLDRVSTLISSCIDIERKALLIQSGAWLLDINILEESLNNFMNLSEAYDVSNLFERYLTLKSGENLGEAAIKGIIDYGVKSPNGRVILGFLKQYIDQTPIECNSKFIESLKDYCNMPAFSASQVLSSLIKRLPLLDTNAINEFVENALIDNLTFLTIVKDFLNEALANENKRQPLQSLISSTITVTMGALSDTSNLQLLETAISVADQLLTLQHDEALEEAVIKFVSDNKGPEIILPETVALVGTLYSRNTQENSSASHAVRLWSQRCIIWLNKRLAEDESIGEKAELLMSSLTSIVNKYKINLWLVVPTDSLNVLLEIASNKYLHIISVLNMIASFIPPARIPGKNVEFTKLLQIILNHSSLLNLMELDKSSSNSTGTGVTLAYIIYTLFNVDVTKHSNKGVQDKILALCMGTQRPQDMMLIEILRKIESRTSASFANSVYSWVFSATAADAFEQQTKKSGLGEEYDDTLLNDAPTTKITQMFASSRDGFEATIDSYLIKNTVRNFDCTVPFFPYANALSSNRDYSFEQKLAFLNEYAKLLRSEYTYDPEFLLLLLSSSNIVREGKVTDLKTLVETGGLGFIICCLSYPSSVSSSLQDSSQKLSAENGISKIAFGFLHACLASIKDSTYREEDLLRVFLSKILFFYEETTEDGEVPSAKSLPTSVSVFLAKLLDVAANPGHFLYLQAINDYILAGHSIRPTELPLYKSLSTASKTDDGGMGSGDLQGKELVWLADTLLAGLVTLNDLNLYLKAGVFEWIFNLTSTIPLAAQQSQGDDRHSKFQSSYYVANHNALRSSARQLVHRAQEISGGSTALLTRSGLLAWIQSEQPYDRVVVSALAVPSGQFDMPKLGLRSILTINGAKLREWTNTGDLKNIASTFAP